MPAGGIRLDADGVSTTVGALSGHGASAFESAQGVASALSDAVASVSSATLVAAVNGFVDRLSGSAAPVGAHIDALAGGVGEAATAIHETDQQLSAEVRTLETR